MQYTFLFLIKSSDTPDQVHIELITLLATSRAL